MGNGQMSFSQNLILQLIVPFIGVAFLGGTGWLIKTYWSEIIRQIKILRLKFLPLKKFNIVISIEAEDESVGEVYYKELKRSLIREIDALNLGKLIKILDIRDIKHFQNRQEAELFRGKNGLDLLIWGNLSEDGLQKAGKETHSINLNFTFALPKDGVEGRLGRFVISELNSVFSANKYWEIVKERSLEDLSIINENVKNISLYILGLSMLLFGKLNKSIYIFEHLSESLISKGISGQKSESLIKGINIHLVDGYRIMMLNSLSTKRWGNAISYADKILEKIPLEFEALSSLALGYVQIGETDRGWSFVNKMIKNYPREQLTHVDAAYFNILEKNYFKAVKRYLVFSDIPAEKLKLNPDSLLEFLEEQAEKNSGEHAYLFGVGFFNVLYLDKNRGMEILKDFLIKAKEDTYGFMYQKAKEIVEKN